jgi:hypothetical protein
MRLGARAVVRSTIVVVGAAIILGAWAIPTFAGRQFVDVTGRIVAVAGESVASRVIVLPDGSVAASGIVRVDIEITNHYPLPVTLDFQGPAFRAALLARGSTGGEAVWQASAGDRLLEQADDSPDGAASPRVIRLLPGPTVLTPEDLTLDLGAEDAVPAGIYSMQVSAYGVAGSPQLLSIVDGAAGG